MATQDGGAALERDRFVRWARLVWVDRALGQLLDQDHEARFAGDFRRGVFSESNGQGDTEAVAWNESGLIALSFIHDEPGTGLGGERLATSDWVTFGPPQLADLAAPLVRHLGRHATHGLWIAGDTSSHSLPLPSSLAWVNPFTRPLSAPEGAWARLPFELAVASEVGRHRVTSEQREAISAAVRAHADVAITRASFSQAARDLARAGIDWPEAKADGRRIVHEGRARRAAATGEHNVALLRAAHDGNLESVEAALAAGADIEARSHPGLFGAVDESDCTALLLAAMYRHHDVVEFLLERGADPSARHPRYADNNVMKWLAMAGSFSLMMKLLDLGASEASDGTFLRSFLEAFSVAPDKPQTHQRQISPEEFRVGVRKMLRAGVGKRIYARQLVRFEAVAKRCAPELLEEFRAHVPRPSRA